MITRLHYDDQTMQRLLDEQFDSSVDAAVLTHVESCETCQQHLETLAQNGLTCDAAGRLLRDDSHDDAVAAVDEDCEVQARAFLSDSDHPGSLGQFGRYEIMEFLGRGGMGIVMRGFDPALNRHSAIKVLAPELAGNAAARRRFSREARSAAAVVHPHVVPIQTVDDHGGLPYLVMPVVEGRSLEERVRDSGPLEIIEVVRIAAQVAEGLAAAHAQGLVHRDIKPGNVLLENGVERVQITDFGLARAIDDASSTRSGVIAGTPQYMSPEQAHGDAIDHRSDLFSLGSLIYFMSTGRSPFRSETTMGVLNRIVNDEPRPLREINSEVPERLATIVDRLLAKSPDDRFATASEVAELLHQRLTQLQTPGASPQAKLASSDAIGSSVPAAEPAGSAIVTQVSSQVSGSGNRDRPRKRIALGLFSVPLFLALGIFIWLETGRGQLRIETNSEVPVPIQINYGLSGKAAEQLTIRKPGKSVSLRAGSYWIHFDGHVDGMEIINEEVTLTRNGTWVARVREIPTAAEDDVVAAQPETTLAKIAKDFFVALQEDRREDAADLMSINAEERLKKTITAKDNPFDAFPNMEYGTPEVVVNRDKALASFPPVEWTAKGETKTLVPGILLHQVEGKWGVFGADFISPENASRELIEWKSRAAASQTSPTNQSAHDATHTDASEKVTEVAEVADVAAETMMSANRQEAESGTSPLDEFRQRWQKGLSGQKSLETKLNAARHYLVEVRKDQSTLTPIERATAAIEMGGILSKETFSDNCVLSYSSHRTGQPTGIAIFPSVDQKWRDFHAEAAKQVVTAMLSARDTEYGTVGEWMNDGSDHQCAFALGILVHTGSKFDHRTAASRALDRLLDVPLEGLVRSRLKIIARGDFVSTIGKMMYSYKTKARASLDSLGMAITVERPFNDPVESQLAMEWLRLSEEMQLDPNATAKLIIAQMEAGRTGKRIWLITSNSPPSRKLPYDPTEISRRYRATEYFCEGWPQAANASLERMVQGKVTAEEARVIETLEFLLPIITNPENKRHLKQTAALLGKRLQQYYGPPDADPVDETWETILPVSPERMLSLICQCTGEIPDFVRNGLPKTTDARREISEYHRVMTTGLNAEQFSVADNVISDALQKAPYQVIQLAMTSTKLPVSISRVQAVYAGTTNTGTVDNRGRKEYQLQAPTEPLLILAVGESLVPKFPEAEASMNVYLTSAANAQFLSHHLKSLLDQNRFVGRIAERLLVSVTRKAKTESLVDTVLSFDARVTKAVEEQKSIATNDAASMPNSSATEPQPLYAGEPLSTWQQRFDAETNPVSKINAATALVALSDRQPVAQQIERMLELGGLLVTAGWDDDVDRFFGDYGRSGEFRFRPSQWSTDVYPELYETWDKFFDSVELRMDAKASKHAKLVGDRMAATISGPSIAEATFATQMLRWLIHPYAYAEKPEFCDAVLGISLKDDSPLRLHLNAILSHFYPQASDTVKQQYVKRTEAIGKSLAVESGLPVDWDLANEWLSDQLKNEVQLDEATLTGIAAALLVDAPDKTLGSWFAFSALQDGDDPYKASRHETARARGKLWDIWLPEVNRTLAGSANINRGLRTILATLEVQLRCRRADDKWPVKELVQRLQEHLQTRTAEESQAEVISKGINYHHPDGYRQRTLSAATNHDLLAYIVLAGGELPPELMTRELPGSDPQLQTLYAAFEALKNAPEELNAAEFGEFNERVKLLPHLLESHPVATVRILLDGLERKLGDLIRVSLNSETRMLTERGSGASSPPPIEPLLLLAIFAEMPAPSAELDKIIDDIFRSDDDEFTDHLEEALKSEFAVRDVAEKWLRRLRARTNHEGLIKRIDNLLPSDVDDRAEFIKNNPKSMLAVTEAFNEGSREARQTLFDPPIPDLTIEQVRDGFRAGVKEYRRHGKHNIADALEASVKDDRLSKGLDTPGIAGTSSRDEDGSLRFQQFVPAMTLDTGPKSGVAVTLAEIELRYSKNWSSSGYGDIEPPIDGLWKLACVEKDGEKIEGDTKKEWIGGHPHLLRLHIHGGRLTTSFDPTHAKADAPEESSDDHTYDLKLDYETGQMLPQMTASRGDVVTLHASFMSNMFTDGDKLTIVFDPNGGPAPTSFKTEDTNNIKLVYTRVATTKPAVTENSIAPDPSPENSVSVVVDANGKITIDGKAGSLDDIEKHLNAADFGARTKAKLSVSPEVPYAIVIQITDRLKKAGLEVSGLMELADESSADSGPAKSTPEIPAVKINVTDEEGKPRPGVTLTMRSTDKNARKLEVEATSGDEANVFDRVLPFGHYYLRAETDDGWSCSLRDVNVEFDKGLNLKLVAPTPNQTAKLKIDAALSFDDVPHIKSLAFGNLEMHQQSFSGFTPVPVPAPGKPLGKYETFPTLENGITEIALRLSVPVHRPLRASSGETLNWSWKPDASRLSFLLTAKGLRMVTDNGYDRVRAPEDEGHFQVNTRTGGEIPKVFYFASKLSDASPLPHSLSLPAGDVIVHLMSICGRPTEQTSARLLGDKQIEDGRELWLPAELRKDSEWIEHLFDAGKAESGEANWQRMEGGGLFHLLRREISLAPDSIAAVSLKAATHVAPSQPQEK